MEVTPKTPVTPTTRVTPITLEKVKKGVLVSGMTVWDNVRGVSVYIISGARLENYQYVVDGIISEGAAQFITYMWEDSKGAGIGYESPDLQLRIKE